jgi:hypothetical protein
MEGHIEPEKSVAHNNEAITKTAEDTIVPATENSGDIDVNVLKLGDVTPELHRKINALYGRKGEHDRLAPKANFTYIPEKIVEMTEAEAVEILAHAIEYHSNDVNFRGPIMEKIKLLIQGPKAMDVDRVDWEFDLKAEAAIIHYHSPYPEVRSVTDPFDDPTMPVETIRSWFLGLVRMAGITALNTFFGPRQPAITINSTVMQLLLAPCGQFCAKVLPDWGFTFRGTRYSLNPGPWSYKEQTSATIIFTIANNAGAVY